MFDWDNLFHPCRSFEAWFAAVAERLLNGSRLIVGKQAHRLVEIEFYYWSAAHPDPFTHGDPIQFHGGYWYFHRTHGVYRGGSFKGLDLTFGHENASGGVLIRGIETPRGNLIDGPSLCVDYLLDAVGAKTVAELDRAIERRPAWQDGNPLRLTASDALDDRALVRSPRVGLALKRAAPLGEATRFIVRPYRYLTEPRRIKKGKPHMVLSLHLSGFASDEIHRLTGCPRRGIERYLAAFEAGRKETDFTPYFGVDLGAAQLCKLYGTWAAHG